MNYTLEGADIGHIIRSRRTVKPDKMNGRQIPDEIIMDLLSLADWAPTHGLTEPWRFIVFSHQKAKDFTAQHAELYRLHTDESLFVQMKYDKLKGLGENVSHIIVPWMKRQASRKIPEIEEIAATGAAIENLLLGATSKGFAAFWSSGGLTHHPALRREFNLEDDDRILGIIYLGYTDELPQQGKRLIPLSDKIEWVR
jgi:nitroreductase